MLWPKYRLLLFLFVNIISFHHNISAQCVSYTVSVCVDGRDKLHIKGTQMSWEHLDYTPPGLHPSCSAFGVGIEVNGNQWSPWNSPYTIPSVNCATLSISVIQCSNICNLIQAPSAANGWETIYDFDDNGPSNAHMYERVSKTSFFTRYLIFIKKSLLITPPQTIFT